MATTTTRLGLRKPAPTDLVTVATDLNASMDKIDSVIGYVVCTSTTRPSTPFVGQPIQETDTGNFRMWTGSTWLLIAPTPVTTPTFAALKSTLLGGSTSQYAEFTNAQTVNSVTSSVFSDVLSGTTKLGFAIVAPPSGIIRFEWGCNGFSGTTGSTLEVGISIATGSTVGAGTVVSAATDDEVLAFSLLGDAPGSRHRYAVGLTPGSAYNCWMRAHNSGSTSSHIDRPFISAEPKMA